MRTPTQTYRPQRLLNFAALILLCASCATPTKEVEVAPPVETPVVEAKPAPPPLSKAEALKLGSDARDLLQDGQEAKARALLQQVLEQDPGNEMARKLFDQISADPQQELGAQHFNYTVQGGDTLARLAERFLGDRLRFYILARYSGITNPNRLAAGQVVKIPGTAPKPVAQPKPRAAEAPKPQEKPAEPAPKLSDSPFKALEAPSKPAAPDKPAVPEKAAEPVAQPAPSPLPAPKAAEPPPAVVAPVKTEAQRKAAAVERYNKAALAAYHRQDLDAAIANWDQVLKLEPDNETARYNRAKAVDLKARISKFPKQ